MSSIPALERERPRQRLRRLGTNALSTADLVALILGSPRAEAAEHVGRALSGRGLHALADLELDDLRREHGIGPVKASRLIAAMELGVRLATASDEPSPTLRTPEEAAAYLLPRYARRPVETFGMLALDVRQRLRRERVVSVGTLTSSLVHPREVFREAVAGRAAAIIVFHNHPSGDPEPSAEDRALTLRLRKAGEVMGIEVADHLILGAGRYVSLRARGGFFT